MAACAGRFDLAFYFMLAAVVFDFMDGFAARTLDAYSDKGKELDSLSDVVSFGVLPSVMLCKLMRAYCFGAPVWLCYFPLILAAFSALRLAKFNLDDRQHKSFLGLPTPACALVCGALALYTASSPSSFLSVWATGIVFIPIMVAVLCALLVSEIPMFSLKVAKGDGLENRKRIAFVVNVVVIAALVLLTAIHWSMIVLLGFVVYILMNLVFAFVLKK
ncbi:MAG: CDP-alcohol phosphatidyltransferase family protein [Bacteroidales bacterium]|nr:CDP-alcohol phosphatidyltransferase family protein [Candidatus Cryptobacteroides fimicaballi]